MSTNSTNVEITKRHSGPYLSNLPLKLVTPLVENLPGLSSLLFWNSGVGALRKKSFKEDLTNTPIPLPKELFGIEEPKDETSHSGFLSSFDFRKAYLSKKLTPLQVCETLIGKIDSSFKCDPPLNGFCKYKRNDIIAQATESTARYEQNKSLGPLDGVPIAIKDQVNIQGYETRSGTKFLNVNKPAEKDAISVQKLRDQGAIILGKTCMHEIGFDITNNNPHVLTPRNPYNVKYYCGGSSGGSACVIASGLCPIALGCDGGGSIRIPSSFCGIYGLKTTHGRVSEAGAFTCPSSVGVVGPMASTADDLALTYYVIAGKDPEDKKTLHQPTPTLYSFYSTNNLSDLKIGVFSAWNNQVTSPAIPIAIKTFIEKFKLRGAEIIEIEIPELEEARLGHVVSIGTEHYLYRKDYKSHLFTCPNRIMLSVTKHFTASDYIQAQQVRTLVMRNISEIFSRVNLILTPATAITAPKIFPKALKYGEINTIVTSDSMRFAQLANFTGIPAVSVPAGYDSNKLPIGLQFMAKWYDEELLLRVAKASEEILGSNRKKPEELWFGDLL
ncbi:7648_t:CDS:10 [Diversispora eburnea]|uniref:7648_t:CDS:1 n=1 Tax=Diversispora eburnea TaxID=1213867 RepID=A0A9N9CME7_9GLOM|nr:7648_t:CDS:10 [Diversispora eburnea]